MGAAAAPTSLLPIVVVGAGPTGMTLAKLLANAGRECLVVERARGPQANPSAHVVNARTLEIFRQSGFDLDAILAIARDPLEAGHVNFVSRLNGELIGRLPFEQQGEECRAVTPTPLRNISQHRLEPLLASAIAAAPSVELRYGTEWVSCVQDEDGVTSVLRDLRSGHETIVRSAYLLGADGAGSAVRKGLGIEMLGPDSLQDFVAVHFRADLRSIVADRMGVLYFVMDPEVGGTLIAHAPDSEWVFMYAYDPAVTSIEDLEPGEVAAKLQAAIGSDEVEFEVVRIGAWHMTAQVADRFGRGRVFLVGDAAHRFPPTGGMGLNTGVADAHNLLWKLLAVDAGWAAPSLLKTYEVERQPIAQTNCHQSVTNAFQMLVLAEALGLQPGASSADLAAALADPARAEQIAAGVAAQATHFNMLGLQLGYCYGDGALARVGEPPEPISDPSQFEPSAAVGARLPHGWLDDGRSTLDLVDSAGLTLLSFGAHPRWAEAIAAAPAPVHHLRVGVEVALPARWCERFGPGPGGALLVRPDQHVAWRSEVLPNDPTEALAEALDLVVGH